MVYKEVEIYNVNNSKNLIGIKLYVEGEYLSQQYCKNVEIEDYEEEDKKGLKHITIYQGFCDISGFFHKVNVVNDLRIY